MEELFGDIEGCDVIVDDLLVWARNDEEHDQYLIRVLDRAREVQLKLNKKKCRIRVKEVSYMGHTLTSKGLKPDGGKVKAILQMPEPKTKQELQRFMGMIQFLTKFITRLSEKSAPLRALLKKNAAWYWNHEHQAAVQVLKEECNKQPTLRYFDVSKPVRISADSSKSGLGAVCLQEEQPVAYASRALTEPQQRYAQIDKELLAIVFACEKFHQYIFGKRVQVETDHKPLVNIFKKSLNDCPLRLQRMLLRLQQYDLQVEYKKGAELYVADALSRAYQEIEPSDNLISTDRLKQLQVETQKDPVLQRLKNVILNSWPRYKANLHPTVQVYWDYQEELIVHNELIFNCDTVVIPTVLREDMLKAVHQP